MRIRSIPFPLRFPLLPRLILDRVQRGRCLIGGKIQNKKQNKKTKRKEKRRMLGGGTGSVLCSLVELLGTWGLGDDQLYWLYYVLSIPGMEALLVAKTGCLMRTLPTLDCGLGVVTL